MIAATLVDSIGSANGQSFFIVGVGASAGGLRAIEAFFDHMPPDSGAAFVVIQHLSPTHRSLMTELLARRTKMDVKRVVDRMPVTPNTIFLIPPGQNLVYEAGALRLTTQAREQGHQPHFPIDLFFHSLANGIKERSICMVLSGTGSDGSRGIQQVSEMGGIVLSQDPSTAEFDGMPQSAIATGVVDLTLSPTELAEVTHQFVTSPAHLQEFRADQSHRIKPAQLQQVIDIIERYHKLDFTHYKPSTINRRIRRRCLIAGYSDLESYVYQLSNSEVERNHLRDDLLITVTRFFRDAQPWQRLENEIFPELIDNAKPGEPLRIWVTACATGEEAYSMAMLLTELLEARGSSLEVKVFATDIDPIALEKASAGVFSNAIVNDLSEERLARFFVRKENEFEVSRKLRKMIIFANHNLAKDAGFTHMHLVSCRNVLIYMQPNLQSQVLRNLHFSLVTGGVLFLGQSETLGDIDSEFEALDRKWRLYHKLRNVRLPVNYSGLAAMNMKKMSLVSTQRQQQPRFDPLLATAFKALLRDRHATCFLVDRHNQLLYVCGDALQVLTMPDGRVSRDVLPMLHPALQLPVSTALHSARHKRAPVRYNSCQIKDIRLLEYPHSEWPAASNISKRASDSMTVGVEVSLQPTTSNSGEFLMVTIEKEEASQITEVPAQYAADVETAQYVNQLEQLLQQTQENLQATIEELETTNEEQQATNEELISSNEELQSTNEELHSVNEELHTVNAEYQAKIQELVQLNSDLDNLLNNINIGVIYLDNHFAIRKFTPAAKLAFNLVPADVGRPLHHLSHKLLPASAPPEDAQLFDLLAFLEPIQQQMTSGVCELKVKHKSIDLLMQAYPYVNEAKTPEGIILTFIDISEIKQVQWQLETAEIKLRQANEQLEAQVAERTTELAKSQQMLSSITQANPSVIYIYDLVEQRNVYTNDFVERILGYTPEALQAFGDELGIHLFHPDELGEIAAHHEAIQAMEAVAIEEIEAGKESGEKNDIFGIEYRLKDAEGKWRWFYSRETIFSRSEDGRPERILGSAIDISDRKAAEMDLQRSETRYRQLYQNTPVMMHSIDPKGILVSVSDFWLQTMGYKLSNVIGRPSSDFLTEPSRQYAKEVVLPEYFKTGVCTDVPYQMVRKGGEIIDVLVSATAERNQAGDIVQSRAVTINVTERNQAEAELNRYRRHLEDMVSVRTTELEDANHRLRADARDRQRTQTELAKRAQDLERSNADLEQFAYIISHDLQEPLRAMTVFSQLLEQRYAPQLDTTAASYIKNVVDGGIRMQALIDGILDFSRVAHNRDTFEPIQIQDTLTTALENLQALLTEAKGTVTYEALPQLTADDSQITQLFQNLISNALKFRSDAPPRVHVTAEQKSDCWQFSVQDNGIGIPTDQQTRIFDLFQRLHTRQAREGYGIGLAICKKIVQRHHGNLWVTSEPGQGTVFYFTLAAEPED